MIDLLLCCEVPVQETTVPWVELLRNLFKIGFAVAGLLIVGHYIWNRL
jgi:hypothetical protein